MVKPRGFTCECGKFNEFGVYAAAHYNEELIHTCECGRKHIVIGMQAFSTKAKRLKGSGRRFLDQGDKI